jgi:hypothetical protein
MLNTDNPLLALYIDGVVLTPAFNNTVFNYTATTGANTLAIKVIPQDALSTAVINGVNVKRFDVFTTVPKAAFIDVLVTNRFGIETLYQIRVINFVFELAAGQTLGGITVTGAPGLALHFNTLVSGQPLPGAMGLFAGGAQIATVNFNTSALGQPIEVACQGKYYQTTIQNNNVTLN